jgi:hypothetical protein
MAKQGELAGNAMGSAAAYTRALIKIGERMLGADTVFERSYTRGDVVLSMSLRVPELDGEDWLVTVRAYQEARRVVGFHAAPTFSEAVVGALNRLENGSMKWKDDAFERKKE